MIDHRLKVFIEVANKGNITTVATDRFVSQPAISKQIKSLEKELNVKLFHRNRRSGMILTDVGKEILALAKQQAEIGNRIYQAAYRENNLIGGKLRIAAIPILSTTLLSRALSIYHQKYPNVSVEIMEGTSREVRKMVTDYTVDFGLANSPFPDVDYDVLIPDNKTMGLFPPDAENIPDEIDLRDGTDHMIICRSGTETMLEELSGKHKISFAKTLMFEDPHTVLQMVQNGNGIGVLTKFTLSVIPNQMQTCRILPQFTIDIGIVANSLDDLTPAAEEFRKVLKSISEQCRPLNDDTGEE